MKKLIPAVFLLVFAAGIASAASCGTVAAPTACSLTINNVIFTITGWGFTPGLAIPPGQAPAYAAADVSIDFSNVSGGRVQFTRTGGGAFTEAAGQSYEFTVSFNIAIG